MVTNAEGWGWKRNLTSRHYFVNGHSLCRLHRHFGPIELTTKYPDIPENCKRCRELLRHRQANVAKKAA